MHSGGFICHYIVVYIFFWGNERRKFAPGVASPSSSSQRGGIQLSGFGGAGYDDNGERDIINLSLSFSLRGRDRSGKGGGGKTPERTSPPLVMRLATKFSPLERGGENFPHVNRRE